MTLEEFLDSFNEEDEDINPNSFVREPRNPKIPPFSDGIKLPLADDYKELECVCG